MEPEHIVVNTELVKLDQTLHIPQHRKHSTSEDKKISLEISECSKYTPKDSSQISNLYYKIVILFIDVNNMLDKSSN